MDVSLTELFLIGVDGFGKDFDAVAVLVLIDVPFSGGGDTLILWIC